jgi:hypothetical protein
MDAPSRSLAPPHGSDFAQASKLLTYKNTEARSDKSARAWA